ncbi:MAG: GHKL domain-containing protein [candidate division Zixibacteria bacterium]|nr:GHKL domain-containing protein [candidate division Zixibacteria bacterium]
MNDVVSGVAGRIEQNGRGSKAKIQTDLGNIPTVLADRVQIEKVVGNLLLNAFEALDNGGLITIKTESREDKVILSVSDNGRGMAPEFVEKALFKPFKSTKKKGLGIGLYQCRTIVEAHQGRIEVESKEGKGSTFRVILPAVKKAVDQWLKKDR